MEVDVDERAALAFLIADGCFKDWRMLCGDQDTLQTPTGT